MPFPGAAVIDALGNAISIQDRSFRILYQNRLHRDLSCGDHAGRFCYSAYSRLNNVCPGCPVDLAFHDGQVHTLVKQSMNEGRVRDIEITASPLLDEQGAVVAGIEIVRDITDQRRMETALREERNFVSTILDTLDALVLVLDTRGRIVRFNHACERVTGYTAEEVRGRCSWDLFLRPSDVARVKEAFSGLSADKFPNSFESVWVTRDGRQRLISWSNAALLDWAGNVKYVIPTGIDITDHHLADQALAAEKEQLAVTLRSIGDGVITTDTGGRVVLLNTVAEELTGWRQNEASGRPIDEVFQVINERTRAKAASPVGKVLREKHLAEIDTHTILIGRDGRERIIADSAAPILDGSGAVVGVVLVFRDVTEKRLMEEELLKSQKMESLGILAGGIAHDYNNLLTAILGNINLAASLQKQGRAGMAAERLADAERASVRAKDLTRQLQSFAKGDSPRKKVSSLAELVRESAGFALRDAAIKAEIAVPEDLWSIEADEGQIGQVLHNLFINAVQALPDGCGTVTVRCENATVPGAGTQLLRGGKYVKVSVVDTGCGIPQENLCRVFDPYFTTKQKGIGLGLATSYSIVRRHDGLLTVESQPGKGTMFHVYLPAYQGTELPMEQRDEGLFDGSGRILLMDDEEMVRTASAEMLRSLGYTVDTARDGAEAVQRYHAARSAGKPYDAVLLDAIVPGGMGGREAVKTLKKIDPAVQVVLTTGQEADGAGVREYGFADFVQKPYTAADLGRVVRRVLTAGRPS